MDTQHIRNVYMAMSDIVVDAKYRERIELLGVLDAMSWFDNFGFEYYRQRLFVVYQIDARTRDIPDQYERLTAEAREVWEDG